MGYYIDQLAERDRQKRLSDLLGYPQQDTVQPDMNRQQLSAMLSPEQLSQMNMRTTGFDDQFMTRQEPQQQLPQNYIRNERTGAVTDLGQSQPTRPIGDMTRGGVSTPWGDGYYMKGDGTRVVLNDGRIVDLGRNFAAERARMKEDLGIEKMRVEINQMRAKPSSALDAARAKALADIESDKIKAGIAGTPEHERVLKAKEAEEAVSNRRTNAIESADSTLDAIRNAREKIGFFTTGMTGQVLRNVGSTDALDLNEALEPIRASLAFDRLQQMREESKTGGALGQVAVQELEMLQKSKASLNQAQTQEQLEKSLAKIEGHYQRYRAAMSAAMAKGEFANRKPSDEGGRRGGVVVPVSNEQQALTLPPNTRFRLPDGRTGTAR